MKQKSADELIRIKNHFFDFIVFLAIPVGKSNSAVINGDDPIVRYGNPVSVAAKIFKYLLRLSKKVQLAVIFFGILLYYAFQSSFKLFLSTSQNSSAFFSKIIYYYLLIKLVMCYKRSN